ncbi:MAG: hypothetical protein B7X95_06715 [Methylophilaceae bacterium 17-44-8]|jgi:hypothetical protein|nr:MAG: hypothetical protein B7Y48_03240 [Methylophilales bacterium 28-44-11]OYZ02777.1 MAG: hypothetical protein B7Y32_05180 [Methylophilales bacterium 16-45-7]OZA05375.1 MAG: hypothetical protein B7X95_06715 [Methylophilaceae bacterium 17-44-8]
MRVLLWLLLMLNVVGLIYFNLDVIAPPAVSAVKPDMQPEKMKVLTPKEVEAMPKRQEVSATPASATIAPSNETTACYEWGIFEPAKLNSIVTVMNALSIQHNVVQQSSKESVRYWVYKPPLPNDEAAQIKADELKALGIEDFFVVQEPKWRNAISFGVFRDEQLATNLVNDLRHRGVREVVKSIRNQGNGNSTLMLENVTTTLLGQLKKNQPDFPGTAIKEVACSNT